MQKDEIVKLLGLEPHPHEGGYFRRTYESSLQIDCGGGRRRLMTSIYYLLTSDSPVGFLHRNQSDVVHYHHFGAPVQYIVIFPDGTFAEKFLGQDIQGGEAPQLMVPGGCWKTSRLCSGDHALISEAVSPGFEYADNEMATEAFVQENFPGLRALLNGCVASPGRAAGPSSKLAEALRWLIRSMLPPGGFPFLQRLSRLDARPSGCESAAQTAGRTSSRSRTNSRPKPRQRDIASAGLGGSRRT